MNRVVLTLLATIVAASAAACGGGDVVVLAQLEGVAVEGEDQRTVALSAIPVQLLPFDRDALFDSLSQAHPVPEPEIPDTVFALQQRVGEQYREWQQALGRWGTLRDSLAVISNEMQRLDRGSGDYLVLFRDFNDLADEVDDLEARSNRAFEEFTSLQSQLTLDAREIQLERELWADEAFAPIDSIIQARLEERGGPEQVDTTNAQGVARFRGVRPGRWWVHTRYDRHFDELYWNVPIDVDRGDEIEIRLTEQNAEVRQQL